MISGGMNWMKDEGFQCKYPNVKSIKGVSTCNGDSSNFGETTAKRYKANA